MWGVVVGLFVSVSVQEKDLTHSVLHHKISVIRLGRCHAKTRRQRRNPLASCESNAGRIHNTKTKSQKLSQARRKLI
jgi:hypothetical protein